MSNTIRKASANNIKHKRNIPSRPASDPSTIPPKRVRVENEKKGKTRKSKPDDQLTFSDEECRDEENADDGTEDDQGEHIGNQDKIGDSQSSEDGVPDTIQNIPRTKERNKEQTNINTMNALKTTVTKSNHHHSAAHSHNIEVKKRQQQRDIGLKQTYEFSTVANHIKPNIAAQSIQHRRETQSSPGPNTSLQSQSKARPQSQRQNHLDTQTSTTPVQYQFNQSNSNSTVSPSFNQQNPPNRYSNPTPLFDQQSQIDTQTSTTPIQYQYNQSNTNSNTFSSFNQQNPPNRYSNIAPSFDQQNQSETQTSTTPVRYQYNQSNTNSTDTHQNTAPLFDQQNRSDTQTSTVPVHYQYNQSNSNSIASPSFTQQNPPSNYSTIAPIFDQQKHRHHISPLDTSIRSSDHQNMHESEIRPYRPTADDSSQTHRQIDVAPRSNYNKQSYSSAAQYNSKGTSMPLFDENGYVNDDQYPNEYADINSWPVYQDKLGRPTASSSFGESTSSHTRPTHQSTQIVYEDDDSQTSAMSTEALISLMLAKMRTRFLVVCALPNTEKLRKMQQDVASELRAPPIIDLSRKLSSANTIRNNIYCKLQKFMKNYRLHDTVTREELKWIKPDEREREALTLYLKGSWLYQYCQRDEHGLVRKDAAKGSACEMNCKLMIPRYDGYMGLFSKIDNTEWERLNLFYQGEEQQIEDARSMPQQSEFDIV